MEQQSPERRVDGGRGSLTPTRFDSTSRQKIRFPAILVGLLLVAAMCAVTPYNNYYLQNSKIAGNHLPAGSIFGILLLVFLVNVPLRKLMRRGRFAFSALELTVIWIMLIVAVGIPSMGLLQFLLPSPGCVAVLRDRGKRLVRNTPPTCPRMACCHGAAGCNRLL